MTMIKLSKEQKDEIVPELQHYLKEELGCQAGALEAEFLLAFFVKTAGGLIYNKALNDARYTLENRLANVVDDTLIALEKPVEQRRR